SSERVGKNNAGAPVGMTTYQGWIAVGGSHLGRNGASWDTYRTFMKRIAILGSTGSIGRSTLDIVNSYPERFSVVSMAAGTNVELAFEQAQRWRPQVLSMATAEGANELSSRLKTAGLGQDIEVSCGSAGTVRVATHRDADFVVSAI